MAEIDYQMALLLQHRFEQEHRNEESSDLALARQLQEQFAQEEAVERPTNNLVYKPPKTGLNSSKSLTDPSWELVDPTPDIHMLFMAFNERYFWNKLLAVCVSWSKRMTSCAGVCSYNGRGGLCSITLSEPLLKLRPRKDLVETLLHEMIHAYLFVTDNNKDRDGHGPEFHKHMYRINKESGTNITVYHDFHDEVRLYQQHWWRCNGPCQRWKPYFGMVRRATNRAPGPNDRWWGEHSRNCGGTFVKVKEPEKKGKKQGVKSVNGTNTSSSSPIKAQVKNKDIRDFLPSKTTGTKPTSNGKINTIGGVMGKSNRNSTITVTKNTNVSSENSFKPTVFNGNCSSTTTKKTASQTSTTDDFLAVRNHWASKFTNTSKRPAVEEPPSSSKIPKASIDADLCQCPVCDKKVKVSELNDHLDLCLVEKPTRDVKECPVCSSEVASSVFDSHLDQCLDGSEPEEMKECPVCHSKFESSTFDRHVEKCVMGIYDGVEQKLGGGGSPEMVSCLACGKKILKSDLNSHLDECMVDIFDDGKDGDEGSSKSQFNCPFCLELVEESGMKEHIDGCLKADNVDIVEAFMDDSF